MKFLKAEGFSQKLEIIIAILLGITAVLTAWAAWQGSLYDGNQAQCYTEGTKLIADANGYYNEADQMLVQDMDTWNKITDLRIELEYATVNNNEADMERFQWKLDQVMADNVSDTLAEAIDWADAQTDYASPFYQEGYVESYYVVADETYDEGQAKIAEGDLNNSLGDKQGLVTVVFAVVLFLLGIISSFKNNTTKFIVVVVSVAALVFAVVVMVGVPVVWLEAVA
jgi:hypothetical protein